MSSSLTTTSDSVTSRTGTVGAPGLTIVIPCYNEEEAIPLLYQELTPALECLCREYEVHIALVDDGSSDGTLRAVRDTFGEDGPLMEVIRHPQNRGIAAAISTGIAAAKTEIVCSIDADCTYEPMQLLDLLSMLTDDVDVVVASPYHPNGSVENIAAWRLVLSRTASRIYSWFFRNKLRTYTSCFRIYRRSIVDRFRPSQPGFVGVVELLWMLDRSGSRLAECPVRLTARTIGQSKMRVISVALAHLLLIMKMATGVQPRGHVKQTTVQDGVSRTA